MLLKYMCLVFNLMPSKPLVNSSLSLLFERANKYLNKIVKKKIYLHLIIKNIYCIRFDKLLF